MNIRIKVVDRKCGSGYSYEKNDCTVQTLANALHISYDEAHIILKDAGRKDKHRFNFVAWADKQENLIAMNLHGIRITTGKIGSIFVCAFGTWICKTRGHVFAIVNGIVVDNSTPRLKAPVLNIWQVVEV